VQPNCWWRNTRPRRPTASSLRFWQRCRPAPRSDAQDAPELLKEYSEALARKLEDKTLQLDQANRALQDDIARRVTVEAALREMSRRLQEAEEAARRSINPGTARPCRCQFCRDHLCRRIAG
jgi:C4-dicarboxylate-specific signal transduction histidine kinase